MSLDSSVDVMSSVYKAPNASLDPNTQNEILQAKKWKVLICTFLSILLLLLILVWTRANVFQSQATIQFSTAQIPGGETTANLMLDSLQNQQRLMSNRILKTVSQNIRVNHGIQSNVESLSKMLSAELQSGQIINLKATGTKPEQLQPILSAWIAEYLKSFNTENDDNNAESIIRINNMLTALEEKISQKKAAIVHYGQANDIVSLERNENRILNKVKSLDKLLHVAEQDYLNHQEIVNRIRYAEKEDRLIIHPEDEASIEKIKQDIAAMGNQLSELSEQYTQKYMEKDPRVISMQSTLLNLQEQLNEKSLLSQATYVKEAKNNLLVSKDKVTILKDQLETLSNKAQTFNHNLKEYTRLSDSLNQLVTQAQSLKDSLLAQEMQQVGKPHFNVLEQPFIPSYPVAPNNKRDSLLSILIAAVVALLALFLFSYIVRQKQAGTVFSNYSVVTNDNNEQRQRHKQQSAQLTEQNAAQVLLEKKEAIKSPRLLSADECHKLVNFASNQGKLLTLLVLSGVGIKELLAIKLKGFNLRNNTLVVNGAYTRVIEISHKVSMLVADILQYKNPKDNILDEEYSIQELSHLIINSAFDAQLDEPEEIGVESLRHTYLIFLLDQGVKLNDLEKVAGYINPAQLSLYRTNRNDTQLKHVELLTIYPIQ